MSTTITEPAPTELVSFSGMDRDDRLAAMRDEIDAAVESLGTAEAWTAFLAFQGRFHRYSLGNQLLILMQRPMATLVAGLRTWSNEHDRKVRKGERAIWIYAPIFRAVTETDAAGNESTERKVVGFRPVPVFDVAQTDGAPVPAAPQSTQHAEDDAPAEMLDALQAAIVAAGYQVRFESLGGPDGLTSGVDHLVLIERSLSRAEQAKALAHEAAHIVLGHVERTDYHTGPGGARSDMEVEAESVGYVVVRHLGMSAEVAGVSTFGYVDGWAHGDVDRVRATADRVVAGSRRLIELLPTAV